MNQGRTIAVARTIMIAIPIIVFGWLFAKDFVLSGRLEVAYDFSEQSPFITGLWPPQRLEAIADDARWGKVQTMMVEPVTFRVTLPRKFQDLTLEVVYRKDAAQRFRIGARAHPTQWAWTMKQLEMTTDLGDGWTRGSVRFDNLPQYTGAGRTPEFILDAPDMYTNNQTMTFAEIRVLADRDPVTIGNIWGRVARYVARLL